MLGAAAAAGQQIRISNGNSLSVLTQAIVIRFIIPVCSKHMYKMKMIIVTLFIKSGSMNRMKVEAACFDGKLSAGCESQFKTDNATELQR